MNVRAIVLAAGRSRRMGRPKQTLPFGDSTVLRTVVDALGASRVCATTVVLGSGRAEVEPALKGALVTVVVNPAPDDGMLSSVQRAIAACPADDDGWLIALGDQPQIRPHVVDALVAAAETGAKGLIVPTWHGRRGHPLLLRAAYRDEVLAMPLDVGLNTLLARHPEDITEVPVDSSAILSDMDTPADYAAARQNAPGGAGRAPSDG